MQAIYAVVFDVQKRTAHTIPNNPVHRVNGACAHGVSLVA